MNSTYNEFFYKNADNCGGNYFDVHFKVFFDMVASRIIELYNPQTVLDAGCATGYLVTALRERGVAAYGIDISEYAIEQVNAENREYCFVHSVTEPLPNALDQKYDMIVCIEVLEHLYPEESVKAIKNLCHYSDRILFSSTPLDRDDKTHYNVQLQEYWARIFAQNDFYRDLFHQNNYLSPWAMCFVKRSDVANVIQEYEMYIRHEKESQETTKVIFGIYYDLGNGMSEDQKKELEVKIDNKTRDFAITVNVLPGTEKMRIDFGEGEFCMVSELAISSEREKISNLTGNYKKIGQYWIFLSEDPQIELYPLTDLTGSYEIHGKMFRWKDIEISKFINKMWKNQKSYDELQIQEVATKISIKELTDLNNKLKEQNIKLEQKSICDKEIIEREDSLSRGLEKEKQLLLLRINNFENSLSWKITAPLRWLDQKLKKKHIGKNNVEIVDQLHNAVNANVPDVSEEYLPYESKYEANIDFSDKSTDVKALAFFLPQFHEIPENNEWWGKGFTEWVNTEKAEPRFRGHYQPRKPHEDIGYYDLSKIETLKKQVTLAKQHGIYGFCFYYYWFSGKRLLEKPVDMLLEHKEIDMPFCLCWANENWTRTWSGNQKDVMMAQKYSKEDEEKFIDDITKYVEDKRYIRINGKPIIIVYNAGEIPNIKETIGGWRNRARENSIGEILIWTCRTSNHTALELNILDVIDAEVEFPPHNFWGFEETWVRNLDLKGESAFIYNYQKLVKLICENLQKAEEGEVPVYRTSMMGWDNACRRKTEWTTFYAYSLKAFYEWTAALVTDARRKFNKEERFIFVNAWNEWAEGTYLEPDEKYGYANINTFSKAIFDIPYEKRVLMTSQVQRKELGNLQRKVEIAVQCHIFYMDTVDSILENISKIPYLYDCYITTDNIEKSRFLKQIFEDKSGANKVVVDIYPNRGRDMAPFLLQMRNCFMAYKYICHIHSKKTSKSGYGNYWREYLYKHLFGNASNIDAILNLFEQDEEIGLIYPDTYPILKNQAEWGGNRPGCEALMKRLEITAALNHDIEFPVGNMFWMRSEAVHKILAHRWCIEDFPEETGQLNLTLGHQIERIWKFAIEDAGYRDQLIFNDIENCNRIFKKKRRLAIFAHYNKQDLIDESDVKYIQSLKKVSEDIVFVTNCGTLADEESAKVSGLVTQLIIRNNRGYDFGAWKEAIHNVGYNRLEEYEEVILANNSCFAPILSIKNMFAEMDEKECDMWGVTEFPYVEDGSFIGKECIKKHLQSYFIVFRKQLVNSSAFHNYWDNVGEYNIMEEVVANCESEMTDFFVSKGYIAKPYIEASGMLCEFMGNYAIPFEYPYQMLLMGNPFVKKKASMTIWGEERNLVKAIMSENNKLKEN